jgi:hypothetical protein
MFVYQVVTTNSDGSMGHAVPLYLHRSAAKRYAESRRDAEGLAKYGHERWKVRIDRLSVVEEP